MMKIRNLLMMIFAILVMASCNDDDVTINHSLVFVNVKMPTSIKGDNMRIVDATFEVENVNTGEKIIRQVDYFPLSYFDIEDGLYHFSVQGKLQYEAKDAMGKNVVKTADVRALQQNVKVFGGNFNMPLQFFLYNSSSTFVISEIYFRGCQTPEGKGYRYDKFFEIYNNSSETLYADGLCIGEGTFNTVLPKEELLPEDARTTKTALQAIYRVPGTGKEHPIKPGETLVLADVAKNHTADNPNAIDLSKADFEWYDKTKKNLDVDIPEVPNLEKVVSYSKTVWTPHGRGYNAYVIFKLPSTITAEKFAEDNALEYSYIIGGKRKERSTWFIDTKDVIDAVECSLPEKFKWLAFSPSLDINYTYAREYRRSVKRKIDRVTEEGRVILLDTNNSADDFIFDAENPSPGKVDDAK